VSNGAGLLFRVFSSWLSDGKTSTSLVCYLINGKVIEKNSNGKG